MSTNNNLRGREMFEPKNISEYLNQKAGLPIRASKKSTKTGTLASKIQSENDKKTFDEQIKASGSTVWVQNVSGSEFHVPTVEKGGEMDTAIRFGLNQILPFDPEQVQARRFKEAIIKGKLEIVKEEDVNKIEADLAQELKKEEAALASGKENKGGLHESGLPLDKKTARRYIDETDNIELLEDWAQREDRDHIKDYIDERIDDIEGGYL